MRNSKITKLPKCRHPSKRLYSGFAKVPNKNNDGLIDIMWVGCCECGKLLGDIPLKGRIRE